MSLLNAAYRPKYERYTRQDPGNPDVRRKALTAVAAKMARVAYAVVKRNLALSRLSRTCPAQRIDPSQAGRRGECDPVDNAWTFHWNPTLY